LSDVSSTGCASLAEDQHEYDVHLIGGDTDSTPGPVTIAIMAFGDVATETDRHCQRRS
jgi:thiamine monophosphate kinase